MVVGVVLAGVVAFAISFTALYEVAGWLGLQPFMWWAVPVFIDLAILVYAASVLVHKARGERTLASWAALGTFTALSVFANAAHAWSNVQDHGQQRQGMVGAVIAGMVPVAIFVATEQLSRVAVEDPQSRQAELVEQARMQHARAEHERQLVQLEFDREQQQRDIAQARAMADRAAELERERHRTEVAKLQAHRDLEVRQLTQPTTEGRSPTPAPGEAPQDKPGEDTQDAEQTSPSGSPVVQAGREALPARSTGHGDHLDEIARFVAGQVAKGGEVSGAILAEQFGLTERTGRRRLQTLRDERPDVFHQQASHDGMEQA